MLSYPLTAEPKIFYSRKNELRIMNMSNKKSLSNMTKIIFISGAPGSGKTTISNQLKIKLDDCPLIDFGCIREFHLNKSWSNASDKEEQMFIWEFSFYS